MDEAKQKYVSEAALAYREHWERLDQPDEQVLAMIAEIRRLRAIEALRSGS